MHDLVDILELPLIGQPFLPQELFNLLLIILSILIIFLHL